MAEYDNWETLHPRTYNETAWTANAPAGLTLEPTPLPISGTPAVANDSPYLSQKDPLGEVKNSPCDRIVHRYADRVLFLITDF